MILSTVGNKINKLNISWGAREQHRPEEGSPSLGIGDVFFFFNCAFYIRTYVGPMCTRLGANVLYKTYICLVIQ